MYLQRIHRLFDSLRSPSRTTVDINHCVHYCAFRYGHDEFHPYETYVRRLHDGDPPDELRAQFVDFLRNYRPKDLGEALGVSLERRYPMWLYPWSKPWHFLNPRNKSGWLKDPSTVPDIITHFSPNGISGSLIEKEFSWLQNAYHSISIQGYLPEQYGYPRGKLLISELGTRCLLLDGNHRVSVLSALGIANVSIQYFPSDNVYLGKLSMWPGVKLGIFSANDAERVFYAYFTGNTKFRVGVGNVAVVD